MFLTATELAARIERVRPGLVTGIVLEGDENEDAAVIIDDDTWIAIAEPEEGVFQLVRDTGNFEFQYFPFRERIEELFDDLTADDPLYTVRFDENWNPIDTDLRLGPDAAKVVLRRRVEVLH